MTDSPRTCGTRLGRGEISVSIGLRFNDRYPSDSPSAERQLTVGSMASNNGAMKWSHLTITSSVLLLSALASSQTSPQVIQIPVGPNTDPVPVTLPYSFPSGAAILSASESEVGANRIITVNMRSSVATGGSLLIKAELSNGLIVVACLGSASVPNLGLQPGQAAILNESGSAVVGSAAVFVDGNSVAISLDSSLASAASLETVSTTMLLSSGCRVLDRKLLKCIQDRYSI